MTINIVIDDIRIIDWRVDVATRSVHVNYEFMTDQGSGFQVGYAIFWETIPSVPNEPTGDPGTQPDNWFQLPAQYSQVLTDLTVDLRQGLLHLLG